MTDSAIMQEVRALIKFYDRRGKDWTLAAEFTLGLRSGELDRRSHWLDDYIVIWKRRKARAALAKEEKNNP